MELMGLAPFFAPIDLSRNQLNLGEISVYETNEPEILKRATDLINENLNSVDSFRATNILILSFINVTSAIKPNSGLNTFQTLLIGGTNRRREILTFVEFLYKDLIWSDNAEVKIFKFLN